MKIGWFRRRRLDTRGPFATPPETRMTRIVVHGRWSSAGMFVLAASGATIGFNNIWHFPYLVGANGGGAFLIVYLFCVLVIGLPLLMAEVMLGRLGRASPITAMRQLADRARGDPNWVLVGWAGVLGGFLILSYLSVIAGWALAYVPRMAFGVLAGQTADGVASLFTQLVTDPEKQLFWHGLFVAATMLIAARGLRAGIEPLVRYAAPLLFGLLAALLVYAATTDAFTRALAHLFQPDFTKLTMTGVVLALGHAFFSLGLGAGVMLMYGAYLDDAAPVAGTSLLVVAVDTVAGLAAGVVVFSVLFAGGVDPAAGPGLAFQALPLALDHLPFGRFPGTAFFLLLVVAAGLSAVALAEPALAWLTERFDISRARAAVAGGVAVWLLGLISILSFDYWGFSFKFLGAVKRLGFFDILQILTVQVLLPLGAAAIALFCGWVMKPEVTRAQLNLRTPCAYDAWLWLTRLAIPAALLIVFFNIPKLFL